MASRAVAASETTSFSETLQGLRDEHAHHREGLTNAIGSTALDLFSAKGEAADDAVALVERHYASAMQDGRSRERISPLVRPQRML